MVAYLEVMFEVAPEIVSGLSNGTLERIGGVIRHSASKQVVAWLRDGAISDIASTALNPVGSIFQAAQLASSIYDKHVTRQLIGQLGGQLAANHAVLMNAVNSLGASVQILTTLSSLTFAGQLLNLGLSAATFVSINKRMDEMSNQLSAMEAKILEEFERDRRANFDKALIAANDFFNSKSNIKDVGAFRSAVDGLVESRLHFMYNFKKALEQNPNRNQYQLAQNYLITAMYAEITRIRCYWEMGEDEIAKRYFSSSIKEFGEAINKMIGLWLGTKTAIYFYKDVPSHNLVRFLRIQQWLKGVAVGDDALVLFEILDEMRSQFWDESVLDDNMFRKITRRGLINEQRNQELADNLFQVELLIENYERLLGFEIELREVRLSLQEWENLVSEEELLEHGSALIVDTEVLQRLQLEQ